MKSHRLRAREAWEVCSGLRKLPETDVLDLVFEKIENACYWKNYSINFQDDENSPLLNHHQEYLRDLGYSVIWNRACLWYEISWNL